MKRIVSMLLLLVSAALAEKVTAPQLIEMARKSPAAFKEALVESLGEADIKRGTAFLGRGENFIFAVEAGARPVLQLDGAAGPAMTQIKGSDIWYATSKLKVGMPHTFDYKVDGKLFGGSKNVPAHGPDSYLKPGAPSGKLSDLQVHTSNKVYEGLKSNYWVYVPAQYDPNTPAALMVFQDGHQSIKRDDDNHRILDALDNLIHEKKIPVMISVFISPGNIADAPNSGFYKEIEAGLRGGNQNNKKGPPTPQNRVRSIQYDTVSDRYARFLRDELLPEALAKYNVRKDAYSRALQGQSSGGICALSVAWYQPDQFSRVMSWIGSFVALQPEPKWGGQGYPAMVQREPKRNIRVWLQDGAEDNGLWPLQNLEMANQLKTRGYDFHFSYGPGTHHSGQGSAEFPASMIWLWRGYDAARTEQAYEQDAAEQAKPLFRVQVYNRDHDATY